MSGDDKNNADDLKKTIEVDELFRPGSVDEPSPEYVKVVAAKQIALWSIGIGVVFLGLSLWLKDSELRSWATGLISLVVGAAIGFIFGGNGKQSGD